MIPLDLKRSLTALGLWTEARQLSEMDVELSGPMRGAVIMQAVAALQGARGMLALHFRGHPKEAELSALIVDCLNGLDAIAKVDL